MQDSNFHFIKVISYLGLFCPGFMLPLVFGVLFRFVARDPFEQLSGLAGLFGLMYALYSLVAFNLLAIETFPFVGLVTCWWYLIGVLFRDGGTFWIGFSLRSGDFIVIGVVPLLTLLLIDSDEPFDAVVPLGGVVPTNLTLELCEYRGDNGELVLVILLELFWTCADVGVEVIALFDEVWDDGDESCVATGDVSSFVVGSFGR